MYGGLHLPTNLLAHEVPYQQIKLNFRGNWDSLQINNGMKLSISIYEKLNIILRAFTLKGQMVIGLKKKHMSFKLSDISYNIYFNNACIIRIQILPRYDAIVTKILQ